MNLKITDIYENLESYRNFKGLSQTEMAEIIGLSSKQAYSNMVKNKTMKLVYLVQLLNNTDISPNQLFGISTRNEEIKPNISEPEIKTYSCQDCISKQKEIDALQKALEAKEELLQMYRDKKENCSKSSA